MDAIVNQLLRLFMFGGKGQVPMTIHGLTAINELVLQPNTLIFGIFGLLYSWFEEDLFTPGTPAWMKEFAPSHLSW